MGLASTTNRYAYLGNGVTKAFPTVFSFFATTDLKVLVVTTATGAESLKTLGIDYTVSGGGSTAIGPNTGTVTMTTAPASGETLLIIRDPAQTQDANPGSGDGLDPEADIESPIDKLTMLVQRLSERVDRCIRLPDGDPATSTLTLPFLRASSVLAFDPSKNVTTAAGSLAAGSYSAFIATLLDDADAAAARSTLDVSRAIANLTAEASPAADDYVAIRDTSEGADNKMALSDLVPARNAQIFTATSTFAKSSVPAHLSHVTVHVWGAGGGGGGADTDGFRGVGGGGGGYARKRIAVASLSASETVTVGAGGTAGSTTATPTAGGNGGTSSFGSHVSATGGTGGTAGVTGAQAGVAGGAGSGGDLNLTGGDSELKFSDTAQAGSGGDGAFGGSGGKRNITLAGLMPGGGGSTGNHAGGNAGAGGGGLVIVEW